jgi:mannose-6-phosphate isomerase-like protein (cupin superfamily)
LSNPRITKSEIWRMESVPVRALDGDGLDPATLVTLPTSAGVVYRLATFPPDAGPSQAGVTEPDERPDFCDHPGMHETPTLDISTVVSGEIWAVLESEETLLRPGDTLVQRGTRHAWSNRGSEPCTVVSVMVSLVPDEDAGPQAVPDPSAG